MYDVGMDYDLHPIALMFILFLLVALATSDALLRSSRAMLFVAMALNLWLAVVAVNTLLRWVL